MLAKPQMEEKAEIKEPTLNLEKEESVSTTIIEGQSNNKEKKNKRKRKPADKNVVYLCFEENCHKSYSSVIYLHIHCINSQ